MDEVTRGKGKPNPAFSHLVENEKDKRKPSPREQQWEEKTLKPSLARSPERAAEFTTISDHPIRRLYTPADLADWDDERDLGFPGEPPYTRGIHATMYRGRLWTMRQFAGFGAAEDTNRRFRYLLSQGQTGLSVAFDLPTLMGYDSDHALSEGEVGKCGVAISSLADMEVLFDQIPLADVTTSMTINSPAAVIWAMYLAVAEKQGADWKKISGTLQNDILKEYIAQKEYIYPPEPSMRLVIDTFEFCTRHTPKYNVISISGYHIREAGSTAIQELAFTLRDGIEYVEWGIRRGLDVDEFVPRLSFFFNAHSDFFEEIAKYRAARRIWYKTMRERFGAKTERACTLRFHTQTAGCSLTAQQPYNCTPTRSTRPGRSPPSLPPPSRCARSRSLLTKAASPTPWIRLAARILSKRSPTRSSAAPGIISRRSTRWVGWSLPSSAPIRNGKSPKRLTSIKWRWTARRKSLSG